MSIYVDDLFLASNIIATLKILKKLLVKEYKIKDLREIKTIISWQIIRNRAVYTIKINQSAFIRDLVTEKRLTKYNSNIILIKARSTIEITDE